MPYSCVSCIQTPDAVRDPFGSPCTSLCPASSRDSDACGLAQTGTVGIAARTSTATGASVDDVQPTRTHRHLATPSCVWQAPDYLRNTSTSLARCLPGAHDVLAPSSLVVRRHLRWLLTTAATHAEDTSPARVWAASSLVDVLGECIRVSRRVAATRPCWASPRQQAGATGRAEVPRRTW